MLKGLLHVPERNLIQHLAIRIGTDVASLSTILSIYQCGENIFNLFDKVCVIYDGRMVYYGAMGQAVQYFVDMGYK